MLFELLLISLTLSSTFFRDFLSSSTCNQKITKTRFIKKNVFYKIWVFFFVNYTLETDFKLSLRNPSSFCEQNERKKD